MKKFSLLLMAMLLALVIISCDDSVQIQTFTVTFDTDGGSIINNAIVENAKTVTKPEDPVKEGYIFDGWTLNGENYNFTSPVTSNIVLKARWINPQIWNGKDANTSWYNETDSEFRISTAAELAGLAELVNAKNTFEGKTIILENDIDLNNNDWMIIGNGTRVFPSITTRFSGTFDGGNHTIKNLKIDRTNLKLDSNNGIGLFGILYKATVKNLVISNIDIATKSNSAGAVAGCIEDSNIINVKVENGKVHSLQAAAGITGRAWGDTTIKNCTNHNVAVKTTTFGEDYNDVYTSGGITGELRPKSNKIEKLVTLENNKVVLDDESVLIESEGSYAGGIYALFSQTGKTILKNNEIITKNDSQIKAKDNTGKLFGYSDGGLELENNKYNGTVVDTKTNKFI